MSRVSSFAVSVNESGRTSRTQTAPGVVARTHRANRFNSHRVGTRPKRKFVVSRISGPPVSGSVSDAEELELITTVDAPASTSKAGSCAEVVLPSRRVMLAAPPALRLGKTMGALFSLGLVSGAGAEKPAQAATPQVPSISLTPLHKSGALTLHDPLVYNGLATADRTSLGLDGLLPVSVCLPSTEVLRAQAALDACTTQMQKYRLLISLQNTDETTFYTLLNEKTAELLPVLYTPTVGEACQQYGTLVQRPSGLTVSLNDLGKVDKLLANWPHETIKIAVITDGERILGLGDQGANGMGISAGKSMVYAACGLQPHWLLPIQVDIGTENEVLLNDPLYVGDRRRRERGAKYDQLLEELVEALRTRYGRNTIIHWEDFAPRNAFRVLQKFRSAPISAVTYNDDIQGTAAVTVAGTLASVRLLKGELRSQRVLFFGAGQANCGAANLLVLAMMDSEPELTMQEARARIWLVDSKGLVYQNRPEDKLKGLSSDKAPFAVDLGTLGGSQSFDKNDLAQIVKASRCTVLVGAAAIPKAFTKSVITQMASQNKNPVIFALSNPTSKAECTAFEAYEWSGGRAIFASGTKFDDLTVKGVGLRAPGFANNAFIFPGIALGSLSVGATKVTDKMFLAAAVTLAALVTEEQLQKGAVYPPTSTIKESAVFVGAGVAAAAVDEGVAREGVCGSGFISSTGAKVPSLDGGGADDTCTNWEACVRDFAKTCL